MTEMKYTRFSVGSELRSFASGMYAANGLAYHNEDHVRRLFDFLDSHDAPYDPSLDAAIWFHDVIYDNKPKKEYRSGQALLRFFPSFHDSYNIVLATEDHVIRENTPELTRWMVRADLHELDAGTDKSSIIRNYSAIMQESMKLYGVMTQDFAKANIEFMRKLILTTDANSVTDPEFSDFWKGVSDGISLTIDISKLVISS